MYIWEIFDVISLIICSLYITGNASHCSNSFHYGTYWLIGASRQNMRKQPSNRPKRGRPPAPRKQARRNRIVTFVTDEELNYLKDLAARSEITLSLACHQMITQQIK
jgi:hypothetical protein